MLEISYKASEDKESKNVREWVTQIVKDIKIMLLLLFSD